MLPDEIYRRWTHSFEEDADEVRVYRPAEYDFPRARGRAGLELRKDGTFVEWAIGPADGSLAIPGTWREEGPGRVRLSYEGDARPGRTVELLSGDTEVLRIRG